MNLHTSGKDSPTKEFILLMAAMSAIAALSIDTMMPALPIIGQELGAESINDRQSVISFVFLGMAIGTFFYGPWSDSVGRKSPIILGIGLFIIGTLICLFAPDFNTMLFGRVIQGIGVAGPRIVSIALIRDKYSGRSMAKVMSLVMAIFIIVPAVAPLVGQQLMLLGGWKPIFIMFIIFALMLLIWFGMRQEETLEKKSRRPFNIPVIAQSVMTVIKTPITLGYSIAAGLILGAMIGYLSSTQQILQELYQLGEQFPLYFSALALSIGFSSFVNSKIVVKFGMRYLSHIALTGFWSISIVFLIYALFMTGVPPLWTLMTYLMLIFFCMGILFGNFNALSLEPEELSPIAGVASAVVGSLSTFIGVILGGIIGSLYNGTVIPLVAGFVVLGVISAIVVRSTEMRRHAKESVITP